MLTGPDRQLLDDAFPSARLLRRDRTVAAPSRRDAEVVIVMGLPGAGKTTLTERFVADGYQRINRDQTGGTLRALTGDLERALAAGAPRIVLDNTYVSRRSRAEVLQAAAAHRVPVRCVWLSTSVDEAQVNAASRLVSRYGRLPADEELAALRKQDVSAFLPTVQFRYQRELEPPDEREGFAKIDVVPFVRRWPADHVNRAVIVWLDTTAIEDSLAAALRERQHQGWKIFGLSWQPGIEAGTISRTEVDAQFASLRARAGVDIEIEYLSSCRRSAALLVPQTTAGTRRAADPPLSAQSSALPVRWQRRCGSRLRAKTGVHCLSFFRIARLLMYIRTFASNARRDSTTTG